MLLGVSAVSIAIVATISYYSSYLALRDSVYSHLTSLRAIQAERIESYFTVAKETDFATNLNDGPCATSNVAELFRSIQRTPDRGVVRKIDYERYSLSRKPMAMGTDINGFGLIDWAV